ncbi:WD40 repeat-like protein [Violaceomyces palustris]|uniref:WD40 repeat-like protein n=1 Tax=Violaceomyces palustris TaxID=1673888 RepID=A0ACD0P6B8_9BASI|nr:WD40 repeat-like protein [Violaceomyces palustris]
MCSPNVHFEKLSLSQQPTPILASEQQAPYAPPTSSTASIPYAFPYYHHHQHPQLNPSNPTASSSLASSISSLSADNAPHLSHTISHHNTSVLSLAVDHVNNLVFSGSQSESIHVWDLTTYQLTASLHGHTASVLALELAPEKGWLFSSSGDNTVRVWDTKALAPLYVIYPAEDNVGDIFALKWCPKLETLYLGCQNTSIQWISLAFLSASASTVGLESPSLALAAPVSKPHKFFDSIPVALSRTANNSGSGVSTPTTEQKPTMSTGHATSGTPIVAFPGFQRPPSSRLSRAYGVEQPSEEDVTKEEAPTEKVLRKASEILCGGGSGGESYDAALSHSDSSESSFSDSGDDNPSVGVLVVSPSCSVRSAHFGYIYCLSFMHLDDSDQLVLASGSGDELVKLWHATPTGLTHLETLESSNTSGEAVLAIASWKNTLFKGLQGGDIEVWDLETCTLIRTLKAHDDDVLCLHATDAHLYSAGAEGTVKRWDRSFKTTDSWSAHDGIILSLATIKPSEVGEVGAHLLKHRTVERLVTGSSDNLIKIWDMPEKSKGTTNNSTPTLSSRKLPDAVVERGRSKDLQQGASATSATIAEKDVSFHVSGKGCGFESVSSIPHSDSLLSSLSQFITYKSVSTEENREDCRQAAHFLKSCLSSYGAETKILPGAKGRNPLVLATFRGKGINSGSPSSRANWGGSLDRLRSSSPLAERSSESLWRGSRSNSQDPSSPSTVTPSNTQARRRKRCLFYGHYDCIAAEGKWSSDPWRMDGRDGYLYGRGVSDNKGPILAVACAASQLLGTRSLDVDVVFLIEGEEESGSIGFKEAVRQHKDEIGDIDVILISNSYWLGEDTPCVTVGLRGVVQATIEISGDEPDVHSGVDGGALREPMIDMVKLLGTFTDGERVTIPGFYDSVRPTTKEEESLYRSIVEMKLTKPDETVDSLMARWRFPSLSVHSIRVSGPGNSTVIPSKVQAAVSIRIVPDQVLENVERDLTRHVESKFLSLRSRNKVEVKVDHRADWWLGSDQDGDGEGDHQEKGRIQSKEGSYSSLLFKAVETEWGVKPVSIREGGSIPAIAILEKELGARAVHLPMGQSSDRAHLPDERIRLVNLMKGKAVIKRFLTSIAKLP